jgi:predicted SnoaL-like aldol condensation-catalyzing enzyme
VAYRSDSRVLERNTMSSASNKQTIVAFYEAALNAKDFDAASRYLGPTYRQHNPRAADGAQGLRNFIAYLKEKVPDSHSEIKRVFADGDFVILHVHKTSGPGDRGVAIVDIFRLEAGRVVEHWDVTQEVPERTASGNPMF